MSRDDEPKSAKGILLLTGLLAAATLSIFAVAIARRTKEEQPVRVSIRKKPAAVAARDAAPEPTAPVASPTRESSVSELAQAMDTSNVRSLVRILMEAAATGNTALRKTMTGTILKFGSSARPVIQEEMDRATDPVVRRALEDVLAHAY